MTNPKLSTKNILIVSAVFTPEPVVSAKLSFDLATAISALPLPVTVISPLPTRPQGFKFETQTKHTGFEHICLNSFTCPQYSVLGRIKESYSFGIHCYNFISSNHASISLIYSNTWPLFAQYYTVKAAKKYGIPIIIHVQDIYPEALASKLPFGKTFFYKVLIPIDKYIFKHANSIIAISDKMKNYLAKTRGINTDKIFAIQNWQNEEEFINYDHTLSLNNDSDTLFTFMYLGNIGPVAGCDLLIDAFVLAALPNCRLIIAGTGSLKETLVNKVQNLAKSERIEFWDVPEGEVQKTQASADVMLLPMKKGAAHSSVPSKLPAYMFSKKPIIACVDAESDTADAIKNGKCGWTTAPENIEQLADVMRRVILVPGNDLLLKGENGFNYAMEHFSKKTNLKKLLNIIFNLTTK